MSSLHVIFFGFLIAVAPIPAIALTATKPAPGSTLAWYFRIRPWEAWNHHAVYRRLGVRHFKRGLIFYYDVILLGIQRSVGGVLFGQPRFSPEAWRKINGQHLSLTAASREDFEAARMRTMRFELIHLFICLPTLPIILSLQAARNQMAAGILCAMTAVTGVYPVLMQRYNRSRIEGIMR